MEIKGPLVISVQDDDSSLKRELHITFKPAFKQSPVAQRVQALQDYMNELSLAMQPLQQDSSDRRGMETVHQICGNLLEHIRADEIDLNETIVIEIQPKISISSFVTGHSSIN
ncbi:MAG: hypothetical protein AMJ53_15160 [Gammaproteobacteria bacterium SG8_11]|nr:MAG: hypothetical protein AMJ53_15160 [Gammaproteobacteria bacterium SG8_11]